MSWTNTQIQIKVPSIFIDTAFIGVPGSGKFIVKHRSAVLTVQTPIWILNMPRNLYDPAYFRKAKFYILNSDCRNGIFLKWAII
ncbi:MAG: hypothetical protein IPN09_09160 [Bacteroidetes bacterium]|nr:hypothetical protein [Bacteroidota bacterium]